MRGRQPKLYRHLGESLSLKDWAEVAGIPKGVLEQRLRLGWSFADAVLYEVGERPARRVTP